MNTTYAYNRAHDDAHRLARRHERDLHWAKNRRRQHERELGEARLALATSPLVHARNTLLITAALVIAIVGGEWLADSVPALAAWTAIIQWSAAAAIVALLLAAVSSLLKLRRRLDAARALVGDHDARIAHTQYQITESVHHFVDARVEVLNTRRVHAS
ncbi:hypothetical protein ACFVWR_03025 [Leifsonia sp. NPDC058292]|uniref:hypothetical protein n=1 Tax=Leifsonia sp. NPDC058292 TaxID=3346428 RepID=UPI0036DBA218